jgi:septum site-determining protein MinC
MTTTDTPSDTDKSSAVPPKSPAEQTPIEQIGSVEEPPIEKPPVDKLSNQEPLRAENQAPTVSTIAAAPNQPSNPTNDFTVAQKLISSIKLDVVQQDNAMPEPTSADLSFGAETPLAMNSPTTGASFISWHVHLKTDEGVIQLLLPTVVETSADTGWSEIWEQIQQRLAGAKRFWQPLTPVHLHAQDRLLDTRQLQTIANALEEVQLSLQLVHTSRRQTAVAAATSGYSVQQHNPHNLAVSREALAEPLYLQMTVRSGMEIRHPGTVVIIGDVNPGGEIIAAGDIIVWGNLKGIAHAGSRGNEQCLIMALQMFPTQIRIANYIARSPEQQPAKLEPEVAHVVDGVIRITPSLDSKRIPALVDRSTQNKNRFF